MRSLAMIAIALYAAAISKVGSCSTLNDTERAMKHFAAATSCSLRAIFSSEPAASLACGRNVTLSNCPAPSACSISTPLASSLYARTTIPASAQRATPGGGGLSKWGVGLQLAAFPHHGGKGNQLKLVAMW